MAVANFLRQKRKALGLSVKDVQGLLKERGLEYSTKSIYGWEGGQRQPDADTFVSLCLIYGVESFSEVSGAADILFTNDEYLMLQKYRALDDRGRDAVDTILEQQYQAIAGEKAEVDSLPRQA